VSFHRGAAFGGWYADNLKQEYAVQGRINAFFAWSAKYDRTYHLGATRAQVQAAYYRAPKQVTTRPQTPGSTPPARSGR
jgi:hypothetical protein